MEKIIINKLKLGSLFKITFIGLTFGFVPIFLLLGILSFFGMSSLKWNEQPVTGVTGLIAAPFMGLFTALIFTVIIASVMGLGLLIYSKFNKLEIEYD